MAQISSWELLGIGPSLSSMVMKVGSNLVLDTGQGSWYRRHLGNDVSVELREQRKSGTGGVARAISGDWVSLDLRFTVGWVVDNQR